MNILYLDKNLYCTRAAYVKDGELWSFNAEDCTTMRNVSNIYKAKIVKVVAGIDAVFVDLGNSKTGFLPIDSKQIAKYKEGNYIMCQIKRDCFGTKDVTVKEEIALAGKFVIYIPNGQGVNISKRLSLSKKEKLLPFANEIGEEGLIMRTATEYADYNEIKEELQALRQKWQEIKVTYNKMNSAGLIMKELNLYERIKRDELYSIDKVITNNFDVYEELSEMTEYFDKRYDLFDYYGINEDIERISNRQVNLTNGGTLIFEYSEACTFIDVNTSKNIGNNDAESTIFETNLMAAREIIRQLSLRNIGGAILVDFISMKNPTHKYKLLDAINRFTSLDKVNTTVLGMTRLGFVEMTRRKTDNKRDILILENCKQCGGAGKVFKPEYLSIKILEKLLDLDRENSPKRFVIMLSSRLYAAIADTTFVDECKRRFPKTQIALIMEENLGLGNTDYRIQICEAI